MLQLQRFKYTSQLPRDTEICRIRHSLMVTDSAYPFFHLRSMKSLDKSHMHAMIGTMNSFSHPVDMQMCKKYEISSQ